MAMHAWRALLGDSTEASGSCALAERRCSLFDVGGQDARFAL
jgi:hypothetical protein